MLKKYDAEFKRNTVDLAISSCRPHREIADDLGIGQSTLSRWARNSRLNRHKNLSSNKPLNNDEKALQEALKELSIVREERDIKKALGIFSLPLRK